MLRFICADIEQNLFRGKIRFYHVRNEVFGSAQNAVNDEYHFILCFSFDFYPQVIQMLKDRFEPLHAQIDILEESALSVVKGYLKTLAASNISYKETGLCSFVNVLRTFDASQEFTTADLKQAMVYNDSQLHDLRKVKIAKLIFDKITVKKGTYRVGTLFTEEWMKLL